MWSLPTNGGQSGKGQPHSKTLLRRIACDFFREVLECGCPLPLSLLPCAPAAPFTQSWSLEPPSKKLICKLLCTKCIPNEFLPNLARPARVRAYVGYYESCKL
jgi:hypothetical protein